MTITVAQGTVNSVPLAIPLGATTVNSTNPNSFGVFLKIAAGTATIFNSTIAGTSQGAVIAGTFLVPASGTVNLTYSGGTPVLTTFSTGLTPPVSYPFTDPVFQNFTVQQFL